MLKERISIWSLDLPGGSSIEDLFVDPNPIRGYEIVNGWSDPSKIYSDDKRTLLVLLRVLFALSRRINRITSSIIDVDSTTTCNGLVATPTNVINYQYQITFNEPNYCEINHTDQRTYWGYIIRIVRSKSLQVNALNWREKEIDNASESRWTLKPRLLQRKEASFSFCLYAQWSSVACEPHYVKKNHWVALGSTWSYHDVISFSISSSEIVMDGEPSRFSFARSCGILSLDRRRSTHEWQHL